MSNRSDFVMKGQTWLPVSTDCPSCSGQVGSNGRIHDCKKCSWWTEIDV